MSIEPAKETPVPDPTKKERTVLGLNRAEVIKTSVPLLIGILLLLFGAWFNWKSPHLKVTIPDTFVFKGEKSQLGIVNVTVSNDGSKEAEEVECWLNLSGSKIQEVKASPEHLNAVVNSKDDKIKVDVHLLNPKEELTIAAVITNPDKLPEQAKVEVRGKGVSGEKDSKAEGIAWFLLVLGKALYVIAGIWLFLVLICFLFPGLPKFFTKCVKEATIRTILYADAWNRNKNLPESRQQRLENFCNDALSKIGEELKKDSLDEPTRQRTLEHIKNYFNDLK